MEPTDGFNLRWDDFETNAFGTLKELRDERDFCDVTLACDGKQVLAHKVILAGGSTFFKQILKQNPHPHPLLYLKGVRYEYLLSMLDFVYTGEANINEKEFAAFLDVANDLQIKGLIEKEQLRLPSTEGETITKNVSHEDKCSAVKKETGPLLQVETPSHGNNLGSQSTCEEGPFDAPLDINIKVELDDAIDSTASFGMEVNRGGLFDREDMMDIKTDVLNSCKINSSIKNGQMTTDLCEQNQDFTAPDQLVACQQKTDLPFNQYKFSVPNSKSNCVENHDCNQVLVNNSVKPKLGDPSSFNVNFEEESYGERNDFLKGVDQALMDEYGWYEEDEKYSGVINNGEGNENHNEEEFATMKKGRKVCSTCGKSCRDNFNLKVHTRIHTGEKPFSCGVCPKTFSSSTQLTKHTRVHTGEKPYQCSVCFKRFTQSGNLKLHKKRCSVKLGE